jgi:predicted  nucleic acid-binding Zn-ribbon protein
MALMDYIKGPTHKANADRLDEELQVLQRQYTDLQQMARECGALDLQAVRESIGQEEVTLQKVQVQIMEARRELNALYENMAVVRQQILVFEDTVLLESFALYVPKFQLTNSAEYKERLDGVRLSQKALIKSGGAAIGNLDWEVNGKKSEGKKLVSDMMKLLIRSFNNECDYCVDNVKFDNVELGESRIRKSFEACNKLGRVMTVALTGAFLSLKLEELYLAYEFQIKKQEEKEKAKKAREELREQQKLEQEIRAARDKILKERKHFNAALKNLTSRLAVATDPQERAELQTRIDEVKATRDELDREEKLIDYREQNAKAGYVYVISNVGAFGEGVYKIGMTRRLEPMDRVDELGDASVPFWFDVHAMVFSDNAPALEAKLHERFAAGRLNKVNGRKEFFRADIKEIEAVIRANYDSVVEVVHEAPAEQYRESVRMAMPSPAIQAAERIAIREPA